MSQIFNPLALRGQLHLLRGSRLRGLSRELHMARNEGNRTGDGNRIENGGAARGERVRHDEIRKRVPPLL